MPATLDDLASPRTKTPRSSGARGRRRRRWQTWAKLAGRECQGYWRDLNLDFFPALRLSRTFRRAHAAADAKAGLNVALLAFPQSIAYSLIAGLPPQCGLMTSAVGTITGPLFSGSRFVVHGPTNATAILLFSGMAMAGIAPEQRLVALPIFVVLVGLFQIIGSLIHLSRMLSYVSRTVLTGYLTAAALLIIANQLQHTLGYRVEGASTFLGVLTGSMFHLAQTRWPELGMTVGAFAAYGALRRWCPRVPLVAGTLVCMTAVGLGFHWLGWSVAYVDGFSLQASQFFAFRFDSELVGKLALPAMAVAFVGILEGASVGKSCASRKGERLDVDQELYGLGFSNLGSALCGGMASSGSLTRSMLNFQSGAVTAWSTIFSGLMVFVMLLFVGPFIGYIPKAALAVVVICIALGLFNRRQLTVALRTSRSDATVFLVTLFFGLLFTLDAAIYMGTLVSILFFLRKAAVPELVEYGFNGDGQLAELDRKAGVPGISILHAEGELFFGSAELFSQQVREIIRDPSLKVVILRLKNARHLDGTSVLALEELLDFLRQSNRHLLVSGADLEIQRVFRNSQLMARLGRENFFPEIPGNPTVSTRHAMKRAQQLLNGAEANVRIFVGTQPETPVPKPAAA